MKRFCVFLLVFVFISGCGEGLRTLMRVDKEQEAQHKDVARQSRKFKILLDHIESDTLKQGLSSQKIINTYGDPILEKEIEGQRRLLYRQPLEYNPNQKVYLYFDQEDKLIASELVVRDPQEEPTVE
ncbi:hypothetical protein ACFL2Y_04970 [Candidatus Omnitrophota bacterium]